MTLNVIYKAANVPINGEFVEIVAKHANKFHFYANGGKKFFRLIFSFFRNEKRKWSAQLQWYSQGEEWLECHPKTTLNRLQNA